MTFCRIGLTMASLGLLVGALSANVAMQSRPSCVHGSNESADQRTRRAAAIRFARAVNTAEVNGARQNGGAYLPLAALQIGSSPSDFEPQFISDGKSYGLLLLDKTDACGYAISTNQAGTIFQGYPIDFDVQPISR